MDTINENEIRLANLQAAAEMRRAELDCIRAGVTRQMAKIIEDAVVASGVSGYTLRKGKDGGFRDAEYMTLEGKIDGERLHDIEIYFRRDWGAGDGESRIFSVSTCCFGSVNVGNKVGIAYCALVGYLATHLQEIQDALNAIPEWEAYQRSCRIYSVSRHEADDFSRKLKEEAKAARLAKIEKRLIVGAVIAIDRIRRYDCEKQQPVYTGIRTLEIEKITPKLVFFKDNRHQYKKAEVLTFLARGLEQDGWSFAADVDTAQFPYPIFLSRKQKETEAK